jgi:thiol-disulfide isomerase/thioredoxin
MARIESTMMDLGTAALDFSLPDTKTGNTVSKKDFEDNDKPLLVMFICNHCPFVQHLKSEITNLAKEYGDSVDIVAISSNNAESHPQDGPEEMKKDAEQHDYPFPYLYDESQEVAKAYSAACTPDFFLFDGDHKLVYRGQFDHSRPGKELPVTGRDLRMVIDQTLSGNKVQSDQKPSVGCNIKWKPGNEPEYFGGN